MPINRRVFLVRGVAAGAGLIIGVRLPETLLFAQEHKKKPAPNPFIAYLHVKPTGQISLIVAKSEMGQGIRTGLAMCLAEEAEVDLNAVIVEQAETRPDLYEHLGTGGSGSTMENFDPLRQAGAAVRELMITAAAARWNVPRRQCRATKGTVVHQASSRRATYGELVEAASKLPIPPAKNIPLKEPSEFKLIGQPFPRVDIPSKSNGSAQFGLDVRLPDMLFAVVARCPTFGGKPASFDATKAKAMPGVRDVFEIPRMGPDMFASGGIVVVADSTWAAMQARDALQITWDRGAAVSETSNALREALRAAAHKPGKRFRNDGDVDAALAQATKQVEAVYEFPFLAHATMEPMNITIHARSEDKSCEVWAPTQSPDWVQRTVANILEIPPEKTIVHTTLMGGGFGRRYIADFPAEGALIAKITGKPVQLVWTREDDMTHDFYRPMACHRMKGGLGASGRPTAWYHTMASTSIRGYWDPNADPGRQEVGGAREMPYAIANVRLDYNPVSSAVPRAWWRSVENSFNGFAVECFIDELAAAAGKDPVQFRRSLLLKPPNWKPRSDDDPDPARLRGVLELAAAKSDWAKPLPKGKGRGVASYSSFGSYFAEVAEVTVSDKSFKIDRIVAAVDCGITVNPESVRSQTEGAIIFGLSAALKNEITIRNGAVEQTNFDGYDPLRIKEAPPIEVHIVKNTEDCGGMGEPGVPPIAPAVANAIFAASGKRLRRLPFQFGA